MNKIKVNESVLWPVVTMLGMGLVIFGIVLKAVDDGSPGGSMCVLVGGLIWAIVVLAYRISCYLKKGAFLKDYYIGVGLALFLALLSHFRYGEFINAPEGVNVKPISSFFIWVAPWKRIFINEMSPEAGVIAFEEKGLLKSGAQVTVFGHMEYSATQKFGTRVFKRADIEGHIANAVKLAVASCQTPESERHELEDDISSFLRSLLKEYKIELRVAVSIIQAE